MLMFSVSIPEIMPGTLNVNYTKSAKEGGFDKSVVDKGGKSKKKD